MRMILITNYPLLNKSKPVRNCSRKSTDLFIEDVIKLKRTGNSCLLLGTELQPQTFLRIKVVKTDNNETYPQKASRSRNLPIQSGDAYGKLKIQKNTPTTSDQ